MTMACQLWRFLIFSLALVNVCALGLASQPQPHAACLLGLSGAASKTAFISRGIIQSIQKIDPKMSFTILTRNPLQANHSYQNLNQITFYEGSMLNITAIQNACSHADLAIFTSPFHPHLSHLDIATTVLNGLELAHVKYFIYLSGSVNYPNSVSRQESRADLSSFLHEQVMSYRFDDYALISTGQWMELSWPSETITLLSYLPIFFGLSFPSPHHYTSIRDIGPVTALALYKIVYPGQYKVSTFIREFDLYDPQPYTSSRLSHLLTSVITPGTFLWNIGAWIPSVMAALSPVFQLIHHDRLTHLSSLFEQSLSSSRETETESVTGRGLINTMSLLGFTPTTAEEYLRGVFSGEKGTVASKISGAQARANEIRREQMNEGMAVRQRRQKAALKTAQQGEL
jgi:hypothetical protein